MAKDQRGGKLLPKETLDQFKWEVAAQIDLADQARSRGWPEMTSRDCGRVGGRIGGNMVKVLVRRAEEELAEGRDR